MGIITPTFNDIAKSNGQTQQVSFQPHIEPAHEPLPGEPVPVKKRGRKPTLEAVALDKPAATATPVVPIGPLKVALIGTAPSSRYLAPYHDPSWTIWSCSPGNMNSVPRADAWFELHGNLHWPENKHYGEPYVNWLRSLTIPVYMQNQQYVPNAVPFPYQDMVAKFGRDFFTSSFAWMMALAIDRGATEIALYGIDMASREEYILQRPGFYFFRTIAEQRGIKISAPFESDIMQPPGLYGYSDVTPFGRKILARETELKDRIAQMQTELDGHTKRLSHQITYLQGAVEDLDYIKSIWLGAQNNNLPENDWKI